MHPNIFIYNEEDYPSAADAYEAGGFYPTTSSMDFLELQSPTGDVLEVIEAASKCAGKSLKGAFINDKEQVVELEDHYQELKR